MWRLNFNFNAKPIELLRNLPVGSSVACGCGKVPPFRSARCHQKPASCSLLRVGNNGFDSHNHERVCHMLSLLLFSRSLFQRMALDSRQLFLPFAPQVVPNSSCRTEQERNKRYCCSPLRGFKKLPIFPKMTCCSEFVTLSAGNRSLLKLGRIHLSLSLSLSLFEGLGNCNISNFRRQTKLGYKLGRFTLGKACVHKRVS